MRGGILKNRSDIVKFKVYHLKYELIGVLHLKQDLEKISLYINLFRLRKNNAHVTFQILF